MTQSRLDLAPRARRTDPASSHRAARRARPKAGTDAARVLACIHSFPGLAARLIATIVDIDAYTVRKRTADLRHLKLARSY
ncbi:hypothetical protein LCGC14_2861500 [marine sediment metagenome]|uniref:Uncharacterized protein n=1 Tax=marine sediment metagenome TaxID=412755 RepID=A0A0F8Y5D2_9ZZZZ